VSIASKVIILGDVHFDVSNGNQTVLDNQLKFFTVQLFPYMKENNIKTIIQLGDLMDNRNKVSVNVLYYLNKYFFPYMRDNNITLYTIIGNHDIYNKDSREIHSLELFKDLYDNFKVVENITTLEMKNKKLLLVPWVLPDENHNFEDYLDTNYIFGHFETNGVEMVNGINCNSNHAFNFESFKGIQTFSGHFHLKRYYDNIFYVGTPSQINWGDYNESKGFHVLDLETDEIEFVENTISPKHIKIILNSDEKNIIILGLGGELKYKLDSKFDYSLFNNHKAKIFIDKDNTFNKGIIEKLDNELIAYRVELLEKDVKDEQIEENHIQIEFDVVNAIKNNIKTDYQKQVFNEIYSEAILNLKD